MKASIFMSCRSRPSLAEADLVMQKLEMTQRLPTFLELMLKK